MSRWYPWESLGRTLTTAPGVCSWGPNRLDVFVGGVDNALWHKVWDGKWHSWESLGSLLFSAPAAVARPGCLIDVFWEGADNSLMQKSWNGTTWGPAATVAPPEPYHVFDAPAAVSLPWTGAPLAVLARGADNMLILKAWNGTTWSPFGSFPPLGFTFLSAPAAASWGPNRLDWFLRGTNNELWQTWYDGTIHAPVSLGGTIIDAPAATSWGPNRLDLFVRGVDNALWHKWWDGTSWKGWESLGGVLISAPTTVSWGPNRIDVFVRGTDNALWHKWWA